LLNTYTTRQGQAWDQISKETLGSEKYMHELMQANPTHRYTVFFSAGTVLTIPETQITDNKPETLPPWKR
jgi:hypothetical protein